MFTGRLAVAEFCYILYLYYIIFCNYINIYFIKLELVYFYNIFMQGFLQNRIEMAILIYQVKFVKHLIFKAIIM